MNEVPAPIVLARKILTRPPSPGAKTRIFRALRAEERAGSKATLRTAVAVFATLVTTTAAAVGINVVPRWLGSISTSSAPSEASRPTRETAEATSPRRQTPPASITSPVPGLDLPSVPLPSPEPPATPLAATPRPSTPVPASAAPETEESVLAQQVEAYREAVALVGASPGLAVVRLRAFEDRWPKSPLREEVSLRLVQSLMGLGRQADAQVQARAFVKRYPRSAKRAEMQAIAEAPAD
jgi:hypothetical protein